MTTTPTTSGDALPDPLTPSGSIWKRSGVALVVLAMGVLTLMVVERPAASSPPSTKLDHGLVVWSARADAGATRVLIQTRPGTGDGVMQRLRSTAASIRASSTPDLLVADLSRDALVAAAADSDVLRLSSDASVVGLAAKKTATATSTTPTTPGSADALLQTLGLGRR